MNKQILRRIILIILPLVVIVVASHFTNTLQPEKTKAAILKSNPFDLFKSYETWPNSTTPKTNTPAEWLHTMQEIFASGYGSPITNLDINGDGLVDILLHQEQGPFYYGVLLNSGDLKFDLAYKCVYVSGPPDKFYGDCAAL